MTMTTKTRAVLNSLREKAESNDGNGWWTVYLDNARPSDMAPRSYAGHLSALEKAGYYRPIDNYAFGQVKMDLTKILTDKDRLDLLNQHRAACGVPVIKRWKKSSEALKIELDRVENNAMHGDSSWDS